MVIPWPVAPPCLLTRMRSAASWDARAAFWSTVINGAKCTIDDGGNMEIQDSPIRSGDGKVQGISKLATS